MGAGVGAVVGAAGFSFFVPEPLGVEVVAAPFAGGAAASPVAGAGAGAPWAKAGSESNASIERRLEVFMAGSDGWYGGMIHFEKRQKL